jgi:pimeloyl-ACP methyl ester carboxylesterase
VSESDDRSVFDLIPPEPEKILHYGEDADHVIDMYGSAHTDNEVVVLLHGGYWYPKVDRIYLRPLAAAIAEQGKQVALVEYRRIPGDPDASAADVKSALTYLQSQFADQELIVIGHSAGAHLALCAAPTMVFKKIIALAPVADLIAAQDLELGEGAVTNYLGCAAADRADLDPIKLGTNENLITVIHGVEDHRVPIELSRMYCASKHPQIDLIQVEDAGHFDLINPNHAAFLEVLRVF